jgi:hypothetical protein
MTSGEELTVKLEDEVLGQMRFVAPDNPSDAAVRKSELVTGGVDGHHTRELEIPEQLRVREGSDEAARSAVNVDRYTVARARLVLVQEVGHLLHRLIVTRVRTGGERKNLLQRQYEEGTKGNNSRAEDDEHSDRVLVHKLHRPLRVKAVLALHAHRHKSALNIEVSRELLERDLRVCAHDNVGAWFVDALSLRLALLLPNLLHRQTAELDRLGRAGRRSSDRVRGGGGMPEVREHGDAAGMDDFCISPLS